MEFRSHSAPRRWTKERERHVVLVMPVSYETGRQMELVTVKDQLHAYLATILANPKASALVTLLDGSTFEIKREVEGTVMIGLDYLLLDVAVNTPGPTAFAATIVPFSAIKTIQPTV
jgi:hypothetical protein